MSIGIRAFTYGYDHYAPEHSVCFHTYSDGNSEFALKRKNVKTFWEHANLYRNEDGMKRILGIIGMSSHSWNHKGLDKYGVGHVRTTKQFYDMFGINVRKKKVKKHLCRFVESGEMHRMFVKYLREDGMGIDYDRIHYKFKHR